MRSALAVLAALVFAGCTDAPRPAAPDADGLRQRLGAIPVVVASLLVQWVPPEGDAQLFTLRLWADAEGRARVRAKKYDVDFLDARIDADGAYQAVLVRDRLATSGRLGGPSDPPLLRDLGLLLGELRHGPLPPDVAVTGTSGAWSWRAGESTVELDVGGDGLPTGKRVRLGEVERYQLAYQRWQAFDTVQRPAAVTLRIAGDPGRTELRLKSLDAPPVISAERMALQVPADAVQVTVEEFAERLR